MSGKVIKKSQARRDLVKLAYHIGERSPDAGLRFLDAAEETCAFLATMPESAGRWESDHPKAVGLRCWPVRDFKNHLIFYRPIEEGIEVVRVLHGARDIERAFDE